MVLTRREGVQPYNFDNRIYNIFIFYTTRRVSFVLNSVFIYFADGGDDDGGGSVRRLGRVPDPGSGSGRGAHPVQVFNGPGFRSTRRAYSHAIRTV